MRTRILLGVLALTGLVLVFLFQDINAAAFFHLSSIPAVQFVWNRIIRFLLNDALTIMLIYAIFYERKYVIFSIWTQIAGTLLFLLPYLIFKLYYPTYNGPLINFIHRLILNPVLLLLLIPAFYFQRRRELPH